MHANSRTVLSSQTGVHSQLSTLVARHAATVFQKPVADHNRSAFDLSIAAWQCAGNPPLILDAGCGVGLSTHHLARLFPSHFVIGVDQSADRIDRGLEWPYPEPPNLLLVRAELSDYWRLLQSAGITLARHYMLYPNPWPKIGHLSRRWHGHAVFPTVLALGGRFECRSNWSIYIDECAAALGQLSGHPVVAESYQPESSITPFERKYLDSGHLLWRCVADLSQANVAR
jgi:tRNA (guanine-N7-)-methyltransferase